jgi:hypothetical protein
MKRVIDGPGYPLINKMIQSYQSYYFIDSANVLTFAPKY